MHMPPLNRRERGLLATFVLFVALAVWCPPLTGVQAGPAVFADNRHWHDLPNAMDVLSNLPFLIVGLWGLRRLHGFDRSAMRVAHNASKLPIRTLDCAWIFFAGLVASAAGSAFYHLQPDVLRLGVDRAGMALAFAGLIGFAVCERVSQRAGWAAAWGTLAGGLLAVAAWHQTGNVTPWAVVQFGGMGLVVTLALVKPTHDAVGLKLGWVIFFYALAKAFEVGDQIVYEATGHLVSGHSLKHLIAALAGLPVLHALQAVGKHPLRHNPGATTASA